MSRLWFRFYDCFVGGESIAENCQILQTRVNRLKSDKDGVDATQLKGYSCDIKFTGMLIIVLFSLLANSGLNCLLSCR